MDEIAEYNQKRWTSLALAEALFTRPWLDLDVTSAKRRLDPAGTLGDITDLAVLCLAGGGGQQSAAFGLLGARVTVVDLSHAQLLRDRTAAVHHGIHIHTIQGDMRELSFLPQGYFDIVWHPYALNFVPDCRGVFEQVARVLRMGGLYHFMAANPFSCGLGTQDWNGRAYELRLPYIDGALIRYGDEEWVYARQPDQAPIPGPREYRHTLSNIVNGIVDSGFELLKVLEWSAEPPPLDAEPGTWDHFRLHAPPWMRFWARRQSDSPDGVFSRWQR
jgi:SAM-dependent methyltransferase